MSKDVVRLVVSAVVTDTAKVKGAVGYIPVFENEDELSLAGYKKMDDIYVDRAEIKWM